MIHCGDCLTILKTLPAQSVVVLDPFMGSGTTAQVAQNLGRDWVGIELNPAYIKLIKKRVAQGMLI
jgi:DNA modification methylase